MQRGRWWILVPFVALLGLAVWATVRGSGDAEVMPGDHAAQAEPVGEGVAPPALRGSELGQGATGPTPHDVEPEAAEAHENTLTVVGSVRNEARNPVEGARVEVRLGRETLARTVSEPDGAFRLGVPIPNAEVPTVARLEAKGEDGRVAIQWVVLKADPLWGSPDLTNPRDVGTLVLEATHSLAVVVHGTTGARGRVTVWIDDEVGGGSFGVPFHRVEARAGEEIRISGLAAGPYRVIAAAEGCGRVAELVKIPRQEASPLALELGTERVLDIEVVDENEVPVAGARIEVRELAQWSAMAFFAAYAPTPTIPPTGTDGRTQVRGLRTGEELYVRAFAESYEAPGLGPGPGVARSKGDATTVQIVMKRLRTLRWPIVAGDSPVPPPDARIELRKWRADMPDLPPHGRMHGTTLEVEGIGGPGMTALAIAPDGSLTVLRMPQEGDVGPETAFSRPRAIEVAASYPDGSPASGISASAQREDGWAALGGPVVTGPDGVARITGLLPGEAAVGVVGAGRSLGTVDLTAGDVRVEATVARPRDVVIRVTTDGQPGLPEAYRLSGTDPRTVTEDREQGALRFTWQPWDVDAETTFELTSDGYRPARATLSAGDPGPHEIALDLMPAGRLELAVDLPVDKKVRFVLQVWDEATQTWVAADQDSAVFGGAQHLHFDPAGRATLTELPTGRYRLVETHARLASTPATVVAGGAPVSIHLDVSNAGWARGMVLGPDGQPVAGARVAVVGEPEVVKGVGPPEPRGETGEDGKFIVRVPGDRDVVLEASHHLLRPAPDGGRLVLRHPGEGHVLRLAAGPTASVELDRETRGDTQWPQQGRLTIRLYRDGLEGQPVREMLVLPEGRSLHRFFSSPYLVLPAEP